MQAYTCKGVHGSRALVSQSLQYWYSNITHARLASVRQASKVALFTQYTYVAHGGDLCGGEHAGPTYRYSNSRCSQHTRSGVDHIPSLVAQATAPSGLAAMASCLMYLEPHQSFMFLVIYLHLMAY